MLGPALSRRHQSGDVKGTAPAQCAGAGEGAYLPATCANNLEWLRCGSSQTANHIAPLALSQTSVRSPTPEGSTSDKI